MIRLLRTATLLLVLGVTGPASAGQAVIKPYGMPIPSFFFPAAEQRAREACAQERPECRASVRADMEQEMAISLVIPWVILGVGILIVLLYLRKQEKAKQKARMAARQHHDPAAFRKLDREKEERKRGDDDDDDQLD